MGMLEDVMKTLERLPIWKRLVGLPQEVEELRDRVAALERKLGPKPGAECPMCGDFAMKVISTRPHPQFDFAGLKLDTLRCESCQHQEEQERDTSSRRQS